MLLLLLAGVGTSAVITAREPNFVAAAEYLEAFILTAEHPEGLSLAAGYGAPDKLLIAED